MRSHTMAALERHQGHFYNWYDTQSLQPLPPLYISSVDSGNLAGHLLTLRPGLLALPDHKILGPRLFDGLSDTLRVLDGRCAGERRCTPARSTAEGSGICLRFPACHARGGAAVAGPAGGVCRGGGRQSRILAALPAPESDAQWWAQALTRQCRSALDELTLLAPWLALPAAPGGLRDVLGQQ